MDVLINKMVQTLGPCIYVSNHPDVNFKYITILFVNYTAIKLGEERACEVRPSLLANFSSKEPKQRHSWRPGLKKQTPALPRRECLQTAWFPRTHRLKDESD